MQKSIVLILLACSSCTTSHKLPEVATWTYTVKYEDRNNDGVIDREFHSGGADNEYELLDDNFDGWYEKLNNYGIAGTKFTIHERTPPSQPTTRQETEIIPNKATRLFDLYRSRNTPEKNIEHAPPEGRGEAPRP